MSQNNLVATFPKWSEHYEIEFDIIVKDKSGMPDGSEPAGSDYANIFHMTTIDTAEGDGSNSPS